MPGTAYRIVTRIQDQDDYQGVPADGQILQWNAAQGRFLPVNIPAPVLPPLVNSFNTRTGAVTLTSGDVTGALGYTPLQTVPVTSVFGRQGNVILLSADVTGALGYTPLQTAPVTSVFGRLGDVVLLSGDVTGALGYTPLQTAPVTSVFGRQGAVVLTSADVTGALGYTDIARTGIANTFTVSPQTITCNAVGNKGLIVKAFASQTANLTEWQSSTNVVLSAVDATGRIGIGQTPTASLHFSAGGRFIGFDNSGSTNAGIIWRTLGTIDDTGNNLSYGFRLRHFRGDGVNDYLTLSSFDNSTERVILSANRAGTLVGINGLYAGNASVTVFGTLAGKPIMGIGTNVSQTLVALQLVGYSSDGINGGAGLEVGDGSGAVALRFMRISSNDFKLRTISPAAGNLTLDVQGNTTILTRTATSKVLIVQAAASQTANLTEWQNSSGVSALWVDPSMYLHGTQLQFSYLADLNNSAAYVNTSTDSTHAWTLNNYTASKVPLSVRGAASQTGNLQEWQGSTGAIFRAVGPSGVLSAYGVGGQYLGLATPAGVTVTPTGTAGTTTYGYRVAAVNAQGTTIASATVSTSTGNATLSASNYNNVAWTAVNGAASYKVYGRTVGSELLMATVNAPTVSWQDTGTVTPSGALPGSPVGNKFTVQGWQSQTSNLQEWQDNTGSVLSYIDPSGAFHGPGTSASGMVLLEEHTANNSASLAFTTWYSATYDEYVIEVINLLPATNGTLLRMQFSSNGGTSYDSSAVYDWFAYVQAYGGGNSSRHQGGTAWGLALYEFDAAISNDATHGGLCGTYKLYSPGNAAIYKQIIGLANYWASTTNLIVANGGAYYRSATAVNAFNIFADSGNLVSGTVRVYGILK